MRQSKLLKQIPISRKVELPNKRMAAIEDNRPAAAEQAELIGAIQEYGATTLQQQKRSMIVDDASNQETQRYQAFDGNSMTEATLQLSSKRKRKKSKHNKQNKRQNVDAPPVLGDAEEPTIPVEEGSPVPRDAEEAEEPTVPVEEASPVPQVAAPPVPRVDAPPVPPAKKVNWVTSFNPGATTAPVPVTPKAQRNYQFAECFNSDHPDWANTTYIINQTILTGSGEIIAHGKKHHYDFEVVLQNPKTHISIIVYGHIKDNVYVISHLHRVTDTAMIEFMKGKVHFVR